MIFPLNTLQTMHDANYGKQVYNEYLSRNQLIPAD